MILQSLIVTGASFILLNLIFRPIEWAFPAQNQPYFRKKWFLDFTYFLGQYLFWSALVLKAVEYINGNLVQFVPEVITSTVQKQPNWLILLEAFILSDLIIYWGHRLQHKINFLWRFHKVHHTSERLDWLASHREHPIDSIYTISLINLPLFILGVQSEILAILIGFRGIWAIYIHSNVKLNIGPLKYLIGTPQLHHWHHDIERDRGNYANLSPLMDLIFGTYTCPNKFPEQYGIKEKTPSTYAGQMIEPLLPKKVAKRTIDKL